MNGGCFKCGARASCKHRRVEEPVKATKVVHSIGERGQGNKNSPWGKKGNPSGLAARRIKDALALWGKPVA